MDEKVLLDAISQIMDTKLANQRKEIMQDVKGLMVDQRKEIMQDVKVLMDTDVQTRFNLLAEDLDILKEKLSGADDLETLQDQLDLQYAMLRKHTKEIAELKKAN
ncbi:MAG: hypothetical protein VB096_04960 [Pseudoflavonifractor sp.]|nr:hypothetical protein [Pseudoflavonifractor sp.]